MPGFDRTGPRGQGSQTGRGLGKCNPKKKNEDNDNQSNVTGRFGGRGVRIGRGRGFGRSRGNGF